MDDAEPKNIALQSLLLDAVIKLRSDSIQQHESLNQVISLLVEQTTFLHSEDAQLRSKIMYLESICLNSEELDKGVSSAHPLLPGWLPESQFDMLVKPVVDSARLQQVLRVDQNGQDVVSRLKATTIGTVYIRHFKKYRVFRWAAFQMWRTLYPIYINHVAIHLANKKRRRWRELETHRQFIERVQAQTTVLADSTEVFTPVPRVIPSEEQEYLVSPHDRFSFPEIYVATVNDALVSGGTNLVLHGDRVICHDLYNFNNDYTSEELHGRALIDSNALRIRWLSHDNAPESMSVAATFVDSCAANYAHWLSEVLPRIAIFCADQRFENVPLIINEGLHSNILESLVVIAGPERDICVLAVGRAIKVSKLYLTSVAGYVPFERRSSNSRDHIHGLFSPVALAEIYRKCSDKLSIETTFSLPKKIFIRRNSGARKVTNSFELERLIVKFGFAIVEPEKLSFIQQVALFGAAECIIASSGAAVANLIFAAKTAKIFVLIGKFENTSYWYWQNMACASGKVVSYVLGAPVDSATTGIHADFTIDLGAFEAVLLKDMGDPEYSAEASSGNRELEPRPFDLKAATERA